MRMTIIRHRLPTEEELHHRRKAREVVVQHVATATGESIDQIGDDSLVPQSAMDAINLEFGTNIHPVLWEYTVSVLVHHIVFPK